MVGLIERQDIPEDRELASKYEVLDTLGIGGMGRVLRARHRQLKRFVAIKLLANDLKAGEAVTRFLREARAVAQIRSRHVAQVMDAGILSNGQPYIVMEYLEGEDLARVLSSERRVPATEAVDYVMQALEALAEAHSLQIIHRDIKPGNLFATQLAGGETIIKVLDFGLAKTNPSLDTIDPGVTERGAVLGTPSYMAPEQFVDAQEVDARADIWAIGATLFALTTGVPPFRGTNLPQVYTAVMHQPIPTLRSVAPALDERLERVVGRCLLRAREERFANVAELAAALEPLASADMRGYADRIRRIIAGERRSTELVPRVEISLAEPEVERGSVSSTFAREPTALGTPIQKARRDPRRLALALLALALAAGLVIWAQRATSKREPRVAPAPPPPIAAKATPAQTETQLNAAVPAAPETPAETPSLPLPAAAVEAAPAPPPPKPSAKPKPTKPGSDSASKRSSSIYERYP